MKFYKYINEQSEEEIERVKETLKKRCMPFLKEFDAPIYRGYNKGISGLMSRKVTRKDRVPRFIPKEVHEELDDLLESMYGWRPRSNGVFTADKRGAGNFGTRYAFFPVGKYQYIWTERIIELYRLYDVLTFSNSGSVEFEDAKKELIEFIKSGIYHTSRLNKMVKNKRIYEAIFNCESYYLVDLDIQDEMMEPMMDWMQEI